MTEPCENDIPPLFQVSNRHGPGSSERPTFDGDEPGTYHGYFENELREQYMYVSDRDGGGAVLVMGDARWERRFPVVDGDAVGTLLGEAEALWVRACWLVTGGR